MTPARGPNPYLPPEARLLDSDDTLEAELLSFVGPRGKHYLRVWQKFRTGGTPWTRPNIPSLLFSSYWCLYRRMSLLGLATLVVYQVVFLALLSTVWRIGITTPEARLLLNAFSYLTLTFNVVLSVVANYVYYLQALRAIEQARRSAPEPLLRLERIRRAGGTSGTSVLAGIVISGLMAALYAALVGWWLLLDR